MCGRYGYRVRPSQLPAYRYGNRYNRPAQLPAYRYGNRNRYRYANRYPRYDLTFRGGDIEVDLRSVPEEGSDDYWRESCRRPYTQPRWS